MTQPTASPPTTDDSDTPCCVMSFNVSDPTGATGISADALAMASAAAYALPVVTSVLMRDTLDVHDHHALDAELIAEQARRLLEDVTVQAFKVGFLGSTENVSAVAEVLNDYSDVPVIAYMPDVSWMNDLEIDQYLDAFSELVLPQTAVLVGNLGTLARWLLPDWSREHSPGPRDVARAAAELGVSFTLVTGMPNHEQWLENHLASPDTILTSARFERFAARFIGAGDTLAATLTALLAAGADLQTAASEALQYLDQALDAGFQPGMGQAVPDRLFWAEAAPEDNLDTGPEAEPEPTQRALGDFPLDPTRH